MAEKTRDHAPSQFTWPVGEPIHRVHDRQFGELVFNGTVRGGGRFSPLVKANGSVVPTLYGGSNFECAAMETVFRDVPYAPGAKNVARERLAPRAWSVIAANRALRLADLRSRALRKLGIERKDLIDTDATHYPRTRAVALRIHDSTDLDGLVWVSRQDDSALALVLFGDRVLATALSIVSPAASLTGSVEVYAKVLDLADEIGVSIVPGRNNP